MRETTKSPPAGGRDRRAPDGTRYFSRREGERERERESEINKRNIWSFLLRLLARRVELLLLLFLCEENNRVAHLLGRSYSDVSLLFYVFLQASTQILHKKSSHNTIKRWDFARPTSESERGVVMIHFALLFSKQGKIRLSKYYEPYSQASRLKLQRDVMNLVIPRPSRLCNVVDYKTYKLVYKRYASLYFVFAVDADDNALIVLEKIQRFVEILDGYFGNVCELDLIYQFTKAYYVLDEVFVAGEMQESSKRLVARLVSEQDALVEQMKVQDE